MSGGIKPGENPRYGNGLALAAGCAGVTTGIILTWAFPPGFQSAAILAVACALAGVGGWQIAKALPAGFACQRDGTEGEPGAQEPGQPSGFRSAPHPLDVDIRALPVKTVEFEAGGRTVRAYIGLCPDGCGVIAWTDTLLPFNAETAPEAEALIRASYE